MERHLGTIKNSFFYLPEVMKRSRVCDRIREADPILNRRYVKGFCRVRRSRNHDKASLFLWLPIEVIPLILDYVCEIPRDYRSFVSYLMTIFGITKDSDNPFTVLQTTLLNDMTHCLCRRHPLLYEDCIDSQLCSIRYSMKDPLIVSASTVMQRIKRLVHAPFAEIFRLIDHSLCDCCRVRLALYLEPEDKLRRVDLCHVCVTLSKVNTPLYEHLLQRDEPIKNPISFYSWLTKEQIGHLCDIEPRLFFKPGCIRKRVGIEGRANTRYLAGDILPYLKIGCFDDDVAISL